MNAAPFTPELLFVHDATTIINGHRTGTLDIKNKADRHAKWIADVKPYGDKFPDYDEAKGYAKLFAASPDLLEALRLALPYVEGAYEAAFLDDDQNENVLDAVKAAIAKATL